MVSVCGEMINLGMPLMNDSGVPSFCVEVSKIDHPSNMSTATKLLKNRVFGAFVLVTKRNGDKTKEIPALVAGIMRKRCNIRRSIPPANLEVRRSTAGSQSGRDGDPLEGGGGAGDKWSTGREADQSPTPDDPSEPVLILEVTPLKSTHFKVRRSLEPFVQQSVFVRDFSRSLCRKKYLGCKVVVRLAHFLRNLFGTNGAGYMQTACMLKYAITVDAMKFEVELLKYQKPGWQKQSGAGNDANPEEKLSAGAPSLILATRNSQGYEKGGPNLQQSNIIE